MEVVLGADAIDNNVGAMALKGLSAAFEQMESANTEADSELGNPYFASG